MKKDTPSDGKPEAEETVHDQQPYSSPDYLLTMKLDGCEGEQDSMPPIYSHHADSQSGVHAMDGDEKDRQHHQMAHEELPKTNNSSGSSCTSPTHWLIHDDQLGTNCSALQFMQMQSDDADSYLPELLEYDDGYDDLLKRSGQSHDIHLGALYWNYGS